MSIDHFVKILITALTIILSPWIIAEDKIYKTIDANGKVHFSNSPPPTAAHVSSNIEHIELKTAGTNMTTITSTGDNHFCGEILLPTWPNEKSGGFSEEKRNFYQRLARSKSEWESNIKQVKKQAHQVEHYSSRSSYRFNSSQSKNNTPENLEKARDNRCAINWADQKQAELNELQKQIEINVQENDRYIELQAEIRDRKCGKEPTLHTATNGLTIHKHRESWRVCSRPYEELIKKGMTDKDDMNSELRLIYLAQRNI